MANDPSPSKKPIGEPGQKSGAQIYEVTEESGDPPQKKIYYTIFMSDNTETVHRDTFEKIQVDLATLEDTHSAPAGRMSQKDSDQQSSDPSSTACGDLSAPSKKKGFGA